MDFSKMIINDKKYSNGILKSYPELGYLGTCDFFRKFSSESHKILFLGQPLPVFSISNVGLRIFNAKTEFLTKNEKLAFFQKTNGSLKNKKDFVVYLYFFFFGFWNKCRQFMGTPDIMLESFDLKLFKNISS